MNLQGKKVCVFGAGKSGIGAAALLLKVGAFPLIYDGNDKLKPEEVVKKYFDKERTEKLTDPEIQKELLDTAKNSERYYAVNLQNEDTVEFRIFRGTLNYNTFLATLQFVYNLCHMVKSISVADLQKISFLSICNYNKFPEMENYLKERNF